MSTWQYEKINSTGLNGIYFEIPEPCDQLIDFRAQQCQLLFEVVSMDFLAVDLQLDQVSTEPFSATFMP